MERSYDIVVAGGGLAGCCAAIAAARHGKDVLLIERYGFLGGMATAGLVNPFMKFSVDDSNGNEVKVNNTGIFEEILDRLAKRNSLFISHKIVDKKTGEKTILKRAFNEEVLKKVLDEMTEESGVDVLLHSFIFQIEKLGASIVSVSTAGKSGVLSHNADFFIDATGDADVCALADAGFEIGREEDGLCQPMTLCFRLGNADPEKVEQLAHDMKYRTEINKKYNHLQKEGKIKNQRENVLVFPHIGNGTIHFNSTRVLDRNALDPYELSKAEREARKQVAELVEFFKNNVEGFEKCVLLQTAPQIGIRESRRIKGLYKLTGDDLVNCVHFSDSIARGAYGIDIHSPSGKGTVIKAIPKGSYYTIPYRSIVPDGIDNVLVAGRPISSTHEAHSAMRIMPICANIGEAAGAAASICLDENIKSSELNIEKLHESLDENGMLY